MNTPLTFEEAGLTLEWVGKKMTENNLFAGAVLEFEGYPDERRELMEHLADNGISEARAVEIGDNVSLDVLIGFDLVED
jgi:hypothetical protein